MALTLARVAIAALLCLAGLHGSSSLAPVEAQTSPSLQWQVHRDNEGVAVDGVEIVRLQGLVDPPDSLELVLLRLTDRRQKEMIVDPGKFLNDYDLFAKDVRPLKSCVAQTRHDVPDDTSDMKWIVRVAHWPDSYGRCCMFLLSSQP